MAKVSVEVNEVRLDSDNGNFVIKFSHWDTKVNDKTGGYLWGAIQMTLTSKGLTIINLSDKRIPIEFVGGKNAKR